jgi:large subunit ribosomal protein L4
MPKKTVNKTKNKTVVDTKIDLFDLEGKVAGKITLPPEIFGVEINEKLLSQAVRVYLANHRAGTHDTKTRTDVIGSTKKIYKQKGTGRARHGDIKAPIFIGGGVAHGPKPKDYSLDMPKKMKRLALFSALSDKLANKCIKIVKELKDLEPKTKNLVTVLNNLDLYKKLERGKIKLLFVYDDKRENLIKAGRNIKHLTLVSANLLNTYDVLTHKYMIILPEAITRMSEFFIKKSNAAVSDKKVQVKKPKAIKKEKTPVKKKATKKL